MSAPEQFSLKWNNHTSHLLGVFHSLLQSESLVDVTLSCDGQTIRAHKLVLSACSPYFKTLFEEHTETHPIVILKDVSYSELQSVVQFMYRGEIEVDQTDLDSLFSTAETLMIRGLTGSRLPASDSVAKTPYNATANNPSTNSNFGDGSSESISGSNLLGSSSSAISSSSPSTALSSHLAASLVPLPTASSGSRTTQESQQNHHQHQQQQQQQHSSPKRKRARRSSSGTALADLMAPDATGEDSESGAASTTTTTTNGVGDISLASVKMEVEDHEDMNGGTLDTGAMALARASGTVYLCRECGTSFSNQAQLQKHHNRSHTAAEALKAPALRSKDGPPTSTALRHPPASGLYPGYDHESTPPRRSARSLAHSHQHLQQGQIQESLPLPLLLGAQPFIAAAAAAAGLHSQMQLSGGSTVTPALDQTALRMRLLQPPASVGSQLDSVDSGDTRLPLNLSATANSNTAAATSDGLVGQKTEDPHPDIRETSVIGVDTTGIVHQCRTPPQRPLSLLSASLIGAYSPGGKPKNINNNNEITNKDITANAGNKILTGEIEGSCDKSEIMSSRGEVGDNAVLPEVGCATSPIFRPSSSSSSTGASTPNGNIPAFLGGETDQEASPQDPESGQVACKYCIRVFDTVTELMDHMSAHQGERPFRCEYCGKAFKFRHHLKDHHRIHTGERPFDCKICGKSFARSSILKTHCKIHRQEQGRQAEVAANTSIDDDVSQASPAQTNVSSDI